MVLILVAEFDPAQKLWPRAEDNGLHPDISFVEQEWSELDDGGDGVQ